MENTQTHSHELSTGFHIASFLILLLILAVFGDLFIFILGTLGLIITYAAHFSGKDSDEEHH